MLMPSQNELPTVGAMRRAQWYTIPKGLSCADLSSLLADDRPSPLLLDMVNADHRPGVTAGLVRYAMMLTPTRPVVLAAG